MQQGITCLRLMLEYCQVEHRYLEQPVGHFKPHMVQLWDDIFSLCEKYQLRILLTPYDTFWMWRRWSHHPYRQANGGPCGKRSQWLLCPQTRHAIKQRLAFATKRWGGSGVLFAWDLWNEIHPAHGGNSAAGFYNFVDDIGRFLRETELHLHGRAHPQTVSVFGPALQKDHRIAETIFCHPALQFSTLHFYEKGTIDHPRNTIDAAISMGRLIREAIDQIKDRRPIFDSEHGPIHTFKDRRKTLPEPFDDEYFRHLQWAHFASGGAGGGMRWPNRHPHTLTPGMRKSQQALARFLPLLPWQHFNRRNLNKEITLSDAALAVFGCGSEKGAVLWLLRTNSPDKRGMLTKDTKAHSFCLHIPGLKEGKYKITLWDTVLGCSVNVFDINHSEPKELCLPLPPVKTDLAIAITLIPI
jgi:mannan endo-1,4-beta-mannosidase